jgi:hypothetical protein
MKAFLRYVEYLGYGYTISYLLPFDSSTVIDESDGFNAFGCHIAAGKELMAVCTQAPSLMSGLKSDFERISQTELSCRKRLDITYESEAFQVFAHVSRYSYKSGCWNERFAREMARHVKGSEFSARKFGMLSCVSFADVDANISDIDTTKNSYPWKNPRKRSKAAGMLGYSSPVGVYESQGHSAVLPPLTSTCYRSCAALFSAGEAVGGIEFSN